MHLNKREIASCLAGLRLLQLHPEKSVSAIATNCGEFEPLAALEIDALCERINFDGDESPAIAAYSKLHDMVSETIESGRLKRADIPDDYEAIVSTLAECAALNPEKP